MRKKWGNRKSEGEVGKEDEGREGLGRKRQSTRERRGGESRREREELVRA